MTLPEIDWERIGAILVRAEEIHRRGGMDRDTWLALATEFGTASHGRLEMPGILSRDGTNGSMRFGTPSR